MIGPDPRPERLHARTSFGVATRPTMDGRVTPPDRPRRMDVDNGTQQSHDGLPDVVASWTVCPGRTPPSHAAHVRTCAMPCPGSPSSVRALTTSPSRAHRHGSRPWDCPRTSHDPETPRPHARRAFDTQSHTHTHTNTRTSHGGRSSRGDPCTIVRLCPSCAFLCSYARRAIERSHAHAHVWRDRPPPHWLSANISGFHRIKSR